MDEEDRATESKSSKSRGYMERVVVSSLTSQVLPIQQGNMMFRPIKRSSSWEQDNIAIGVSAPSFAESKRHPVTMSGVGQNAKSLCVQWNPRKFDEQSHARSLKGINGPDCAPPPITSQDVSICYCLKSESPSRKHFRTSKCDDIDFKNGSKPMEKLGTASHPSCATPLLQGQLLYRAGESPPVLRANFALPSTMTSFNAEHPTANPTQNFAKSRSLLDAPRGGSFDSDVASFLRDAYQQMQQEAGRSVGSEPRATPMVFVPSSLSMPPLN